MLCPHFKAVLDAEKYESVRFLEEALKSSKRGRDTEKRERERDRERERERETERKWRGQREGRERENGEKEEDQKNRCQRFQGARPIAPGQQGFLWVLLIVCTWLPPCHLQQMTNTYLLSERLSDSNLKEMAWSEHQFQTEFILSISSPRTLQSQPLTVMGGSSTDLLMLQ